MAEGPEAGLAIVDSLALVEIDSLGLHSRGNLFCDRDHAVFRGVARRDVGHLVVASGLLLDTSGLSKDG